MILFLLKLAATIICHDMLIMPLLATTTTKRNYKLRCVVVAVVAKIDIILKLTILFILQQLVLSF
jgi:hypothetical protein